MTSHADFTFNTQQLYPELHCCIIAHISDLITVFPLLGFHFYSAVTEAGKVGDRLSQDFFRGEYNLNHMIGKFETLSSLPSPLLSTFMDLTVTCSVVDGSSV